MADVSALLAQYLSVKSQINYNQLQETKWAGLHEQMAAKLSKQTTAESKWESSSMDANDKLTSSGQKFEYSGNGVKISKSDSDRAWTDAKAQASAEAYAYAKVKNYDPNKLDEYAELDIQYDTMQATYETLLESLNAQAESLKSTLSNATKDTGMLDQ